MGDGVQVCLSYLPCEEGQEMSANLLQENESSSACLPSFTNVVGGSW